MVILADSVVFSSITFVCSTIVAFAVIPLKDTAAWSIRASTSRKASFDGSAKPTAHKNRAVDSTPNFIGLVGIIPGLRRSKRHISSDVLFRIEDRFQTGDCLLLAGTGF